MKNKITFSFLVLLFILTSAEISFTQDGQLDATFGQGGKVMNAFNVIGSGYISASAIQSDGKIITAGFCDLVGQNTFAISRYTITGDLDNTFGNNGIVYTQIGSSSDVAYAVAIQGNGKIVAAGSSNNGGTNDFAIARYNQDGSLDNTFGTNGTVVTPIGTSSDIAYSVTIQSDGKIIAAGTANFATIDFALVRYNQNGSLDNTFGTNGVVITQIGPTSDVAQSINMQTDGKIVIAGYSVMNIVTGQTDFVVARYNQNGSLDNTFGTIGYVTTQIGNSYDLAHSSMIQSDGKIVAAGKYSSGSSYDFALARYNQDGDLDNTFGTNGIVTTQIGLYEDQINSVKIQSDGKIVVAGYTDDGTYEDFALARYNANGTVDITFGINGVVIMLIGSSDENVNSLEIQSDGKLVAVGVSYDGNEDRCVLIRYSVNGIVDNTYGMNGIVITQYGNARNTIRSVKIQPDGKIVVAGDVLDGNNFGFALARYNGNGDLDNTFGVNGFVLTQIGTSSDQINSLALQSDGKILAAGYTYSGTTFKFALARYDQNGTLDNTFGTSGIVITQIGVDGDQINSIAIQGDGKILAAGNYYNGSNYDFVLVRYNLDGSLDNTFGINGIVTTQIGSAGEEINSLLVQPDGKIVAGGYSETGTNNFTLARYNPNGTLDNTFGTNGITTNTLIGEAKTIMRQADGKIVSSCYFYNGVDADFGIVRYNSNGTLDNTFGTNGITSSPIGSSNDYVYSSAIQTDGKIVLAGYYDKVNDADFALARFNTNGMIDNTFGTNGIVTTSIGLGYNYAFSMAIQNDKKIIIAGASQYIIDYIVFTLARYIGDAASGLDENFGNIPTVYDLEQNYPNPFNPSTTIKYEIPIPSHVSLKVYDILGNEVATLVNEEKRAGEYEVIFNAAELTSGIYFYQLQTGEFNSTRKLIFLK
ncbi:MAG: T9SS type A sorting domain-containing protein [Nitrososphaerales archaeon]